jgi:hypothetical protein
MQALVCGVVAYREGWKRILSISLHVKWRGSKFEKDRNGERERRGGGGIIVYKIFIKRKSSKLGGYEIKFCNKTCFRGEKKIFIGGNLNAGKIMIINFAY